MKKLLSALIFLVSLSLFAQDEENQWIRAFPITDYIVDIQENVQLVQIQLPSNLKLQDKQMGLLRGTYKNKLSDTLDIGIGRRYHVRGVYQFFAVEYLKERISPAAGDLIFTAVDKSAVYQGNLVNLALLYIGLKDVEEEPFYDRENIFYSWTKDDELKATNKMLADVQYTAETFLKSNPEMNQTIRDGKNQGKPLLQTMKSCTKKDLEDFFAFVLKKSGKYASREWKISEVFATWLLIGSPTS